MHRYCIMQYVFYLVSNTIYEHFSSLEFKWHNDLKTRQAESPRPAALLILIS